MKALKDLRWHLRITLLPQCNFRCRYCNPNAEFEHAKVMNDKKIIEIVKAAVINGIVRIHWTGGEPCLKNVVALFSKAKEAGMIEQIMTTNGSLRINEIFDMKKAGLSRVNISLDSLNVDKNQKITGRNYLFNTIKWIETACQTFDMITKMNIVPMKDNLNEIPNFIRFAQKFNGKLLLKFIELCPNNPAFYGNKIQNYHVSRNKIITELKKIGSLQRTTDIGDNPNAEYYFVGDTKVKIILITMPSQNFKCGLEACHKMRISPYGLIGSCIQQKGTDIKELPLKEKTKVIKEKMDIRHNYSDIPPVSRQHLRKDYRIWRFGVIKQETKKEQTFFCIRPYIFEKRDVIKKMISTKGLNIKKSKITWLTEKDLRIMYGHEEPSIYFDACIHFMAQGFVEVGIIEGKDVISKLVKLSSTTHIPSESHADTIRNMFGKKNPIDFNGLSYYLNPLHRSRNQAEAKKEINLFWNLYNRPAIKTISNMMYRLYKNKNLECVYYHHIKPVVKIGRSLCKEFGGNKTIIELACWLHDIASLKSGEKYQHDIKGGEDAKRILKLLRYKNDVINSVKYCIESHRGSFPTMRITREAEIVCAADGISNLQYPPLLYFFAFKIKNMEFDEGMKKIKLKVKNSYNKIPQFAKEKSKIYYENWQTL